MIPFYIKKEHNHIHILNNISKCTISLLYKLLNSEKYKLY